MDKETLENLVQLITEKANYLNSLGMDKITQYKVYRALLTTLNIGYEAGYARGNNAYVPFEKLPSEAQQESLKLTSPYTNILAPNLTKEEYDLIYPGSSKA